MSGVYPDEYIGSVSPLINQGQLFSLFEKNQTTLPLELTNQILARLSEVAPVETPFFYPGVVFWHFPALRDALALLESGQNELDLATTARDLGYLHILNPRMYCVDCNRNLMRVIRSIDKHPQSRSMIAQHPLTGLKRYLSALSRNVKTYESQNPPYSSPTQLHIMHSWGGGLHQWVANYIDADSNGNNYVLKSIGDWSAFGKRLSLYRHPNDEQAINYWDLYLPIQGTALVHHQYAQILGNIVYEYGIDVILVSSLIGHSLDVLNTKIKTLSVLHDYYPFCPALYIHYNDVCNSCDASRLAECERNNPLNFLFKGISEDQWMRVRRRYVSLIVRNQIILVTPSHTAAQHCKTLMPELKDQKFVHIPHGMPADLIDTKKTTPARQRRRKILVLGKVDTQKGLALYREIIKEISSFADIIFLGCGDEGLIFQDTEGVTVDPVYQPYELTTKLQSYAPDLGLLLPIWPETFSYTLSELMIHAIPTVVSRRGAPMERIEDFRNGFLVDPEPKKITSLLLGLVESPQAVDQVRQQLVVEEFRSAQSMVTDYQRILIRDSIELVNSYAMICLSRQVPRPDNMNRPTTFIGEGDFFEVMRQFEHYLASMVDKLPNVNAFARWIFSLGVKVWLGIPIRFAAWYVRLRK